MKRHWKAIVPALMLGGMMVAAAPPQAAADCGPLAKGEVYVVAGRDVPCIQAREVMRRYIDGEPVRWTCGGAGRGSWCESPPDARIELRN